MEVAGEEVKRGEEENVEETTQVDAAVLLRDVRVGNQRIK